MPWYTYLNKEDIERWSFTDDHELNDLFQEAKKLNPALLISSTSFWLKMGLFKKKKLVTLYSIRYNEGRDQCRIVNFAPIDKSYVLNEYVDKASVMNYLFGFITGYQYVANAVRIK